jgi:hypothetical protein
MTMTENTGFPPAGPSPELVTSSQPVNQADAAAAAQAQLAKAAADLRAEGGSDQDPALQAKIREQVTRDVLLPMEQKIDDLVAKFSTESAEQGALIRALQAQLAGAQQAAGAPDVVKYADAVRDRLQNAADLSGMPKEHWAGVLETAGQLSDAARTAVQDQDGSGLGKGIAAVERWVSRTHPRTSNQRIEHFPAVLADLDELVSAAERIAPAVAGAV